MVYLMKYLSLSYTVSFLYRSLFSVKFQVFFCIDLKGIELIVSSGFFPKKNIFL